MKIDFVVPWVDSTDDEWFKEFADFSKKVNGYEDASDKRYRDWGLFKYWFRGVEKYAPWVNKIHFVTYGHTPSWLDVDNPKINVVNHKDYIPSGYLPTFSARPIEVNLHRIEELSEYFVYFNDDMFIINQLAPESFFVKGLPCDSAILDAYDGVRHARMGMNNVSVINTHFNKRKVIKNNFKNWFNFKYDKQQLRNFLLLPWARFTGFYDYHLPNAYLKSTFKKLWCLETDKLNLTSSSKFRNDNTDLNQYVFRFWQLASNKFNPINKGKLGDYFSIGMVDFDDIFVALNKSKKPIACLNDHDPENLDLVIERLKAFFEKKFPEKSSFEL